MKRLLRNKRKQKDANAPDIDQLEFYGDRLNFAASEAYKLLRTNLTFSMPDEKKKCRIVGVTSAMKGEGKSTTSINLAYTLAETGKKVLLLECDLRLPTMAVRLNLNRSPGLSNLLAGMVQGTEALQKSGLIKNMYVITSGDIPPNPSELLGSDQIKVVLELLSQAFDYIVLDLPPVSIVSDALVISKLTSGMIVVTRQDYCSKRLLADTIRQLRFVNAKILGLVMTGSRSAAKSYKYKKYGKGSKYGSYAYESYEKKPVGKGG